MTIELSPGLVAAADDQERRAPVQRWPVRHSPSVLAGTLHVPATAEEADAIVSKLERLRIGAVGIDTEFRFGRPLVELGRNRTWSDISSLEPLLLSAAVWVPDDDAIIEIVFDLTNPSIIPIISRLLRLRVTFVAHNIKAEFQTLWAIGLRPILHQTWDTYIAARALQMGRANRRLAALATARKDEEIGQAAEIEQELHGTLSLLGLCHHYDVTHEFSATKTTMQRGFLAHPAGAPFTLEQLTYAASDATATLEIYLRQQPEVVSEGLLNHLIDVEFPFAEANAWMEFTGVPIDQHKLVVLRQGLGRAVAQLKDRLQAAGIDNPASPDQIATYLVAKGLGPKITRKGKLTTSEEVLETIERLDPVIPDIRRLRKYSSLLAGPLLTGDLIGTDGRLHPTHRHLGADTGRNTCSSPNIVGISKTFRPVVVAPHGRALIEADYAQIEVGIAAAEFGDAALIAAFNSADVYAAVAQRFYHDELSDAERSLTVSEFKKTRKDLRNKVKTFVLAIIYGMGDQAIADRFGVTLAEAGRQRADFMDRFPEVRSAMVRAVENHKVSGYAPILGGLRRAIPPGWRSDNQAINTPIQGSAGVVFRRAVVDLYRHFRGTGTLLVLPAHDAILIECDHDQIDAVAAETRMIMQMAVRRYYPELTPRVDIALSDTSCWSKDGRSDSIDRFLENPDFKL